MSRQAGKRIVPLSPKQKPRDPFQECSKGDFPRREDCLSPSNLGEGPLSLPSNLWTLPQVLEFPGIEPHTIAIWAEVHDHPSNFHLAQQCSIVGTREGGPMLLAHPSKDLLLSGAEERVD